MLIFFIVLVSQLLKKKVTVRPAPKLFRSPGSGQTRLTILLFVASQAPQESTRETACLNFRQQLAVVLQLLWSTFLTRWVGPRHATSESLPPSKPFRPHPLDIYYMGDGITCQFDLVIASTAKRSHVFAIVRDDHLDT